MKKIKNLMRDCGTVAEILCVLLLVVAVFCVGVWVLQLCWNYLMPDLFGLPTISLKQAFVLDILVWILFGHSSSKGD